MNSLPQSQTTRRDFLKTSALVGGALAAPSLLTGPAWAQPAAPNTGILRIGLIGCGGRGSGAASQALKADPNVVLTAMGDVFDEQLQKSLKSLLKEEPDKVKVTSEKCFVGLDAYQKVIDSGVDVVLLATPPGFRPMHLKAAVAAGKHIFCEKPLGTDASGVRSALESVRTAKAKGLSLVSGFCQRYDSPRREFYRRIHDGAIGNIGSVYANYFVGRVKPMPAASERGADVTDLEWQLRNWYNFVWLSGDGYVEQAVHSVDKVAWALKDQMPLKAVAMGGRQMPNNQGNIFDHFFVIYEFPDDIRAFVGHRQVGNSYSDVSDHIVGSVGIGEIKGQMDPIIKGRETWHYQGVKPNMYQVEHDELFASIRGGKAKNDGEWMAHTTMMAIMGRMAAYTGKEITWEQALNSEEKLVPDSLDWNMKLDISPMAVPGVTKLV